ncbi:hypothetical protein [Rhizobium laguerreae]|uniref:Uncharacterized protein n=1 Tax=Rhizobium laguerreae TaxID=1076926 RepID=A0A6N9ZJA1_9HYPH|nr:hypothetical protein [Rhizobium laguerreae]NEH93503.1 hypothetical protein [Rhizobium laguerreae]
MKKPAPIKPLDPVLADFIRALARETARIDHERMMRGEKVSTEIEIRPARKFRGKIRSRVPDGQGGYTWVEEDFQQFNQRRQLFLEQMMRVVADMRAGRDDEIGLSKLLKK